MKDIKRIVIICVVVLCILPLLAFGAFASFSYTAIPDSDGFCYLGTILPEDDYRLIFGFPDGTEVVVAECLTVEYDINGECLIFFEYNTDTGDGFLTLDFVFIDFIMEGQSVLILGVPDGEDFVPFSSDFYMRLEDIPGNFSLIEAVSDSFYAVLGWFTRINFELSPSGSLPHLTKFFVVGIAVSALLVALKIFRTFCWR